MAHRNIFLIGREDMSIEAEKYKPVNDIRVVTATSLFAVMTFQSIVMRILQDTGVEVIHLITVR